MKCNWYGLPPTTSTKACAAWVCGGAWRSTTSGTWLSRAEHGGASAWSPTRVVAGRTGLFPRPDRGDRQQCAGSAHRNLYFQHPAQQRPGGRGLGAGCCAWSGGLPGDGRGWHPDTGAAVVPPFRARWCGLAYFCPDGPAWPADPEPLAPATPQAVRGRRTTGILWRNQPAG